MPTLGIDYAWSKPRPAAIKAAGYAFVCRYLSNDPKKNLTAAEAGALHALGISVAVVWEATANRALGGAAAGATDGREAKTQAATCGLPDSAAIYYAVDFDAQPGQFPAIVAYQQAFASAIAPHPVGVYGGVAVVSYMTGHGARYGWQTAAWSRGQRTGAASLFQRVQQVRVDGVLCDVNEATGDFGAWTTDPPPAPPAAVITTGQTTEDGMTPHDCTHITLDGNGNGHVTFAGVAPGSYFCTAPNGQDPEGITNGQQNGYTPPPTFDYCDHGGSLRVIIHGGPKNGAIDFRVWTTP